MNGNQIRETFINYFKSENHQFVHSASMVLKNDPTLMFTNAGMNQFKDIFLNNTPAKYKRIVNSQKCLRVSGKHNDLEEVGHDTYHHTMFEMLGNWSFGDYFKEEAIDMAWELLINVFKIPHDRLYATIFEGSKEDNLELDKEAYDFWKKYLPENKIIHGSKKDNFWEMGNTGPCGPCSEIHIDIRDDKERKKTDGKNLVNKDHPEVIEIWNLVFIQYNRKANGILETLPMKHIDTGLGFERLCMVIQNKKSNYDTDIFQPLINELSKISNKKYGIDNETDIAMRVIADHLRAISFSIADGQLPSNNKAGYVIRRILRRAVRYGYTFLDLKNPFINKLVPVLINNMADAYPELNSQKELIIKVITEEEISFLRTLDTGIKLLDQIIDKTKKDNYKIVNGKLAFELYDTYGFPLDLTQLILKEHDLIVNKREFDNEMEKQKNRSRNAAIIDAHDWTIIFDDDIEEFVGYDYLESKIKITKYRKIKSKGNEFYQLVFNLTPFYAESGGQVGDTGYIEYDNEKISIIDTIKENNLHIHLSKTLPSDPTATFNAVVNKSNRNLIVNNHTATHLLHYALKKVLGDHVEQKGSLVHPDYLRFDFSHFQKITSDELNKIEKIVNKNIRENLTLEENRSIPIDKAIKMGAVALFGEKYGDTVRTIKFGDSIELCGGTHAKATGQIGYFKIISESAIAAGIRRIEAITADKSEELINNYSDILKNIKFLLKSPKDIEISIENLIKENASLNKTIELYNKEKIKSIKNELKNNIEDINGINLIYKKIDINSAESIKDMAFQLKSEVKNLFLIIGAEINNKAHLSIMISDNLTKEKNLNANSIIRQIAVEINGGGGGQPFFATAGGKNPKGIQKAIDKAKEFVCNI
ncbi:MAG: alanine--tRNA ligase [Bacteroidales bacterium]|nr:alanine--tRNA ligase [Bacteroidales bacterium]